MKKQLLNIFSSVSGTFTIDEEINQASTGVGKVVEFDSTNKILYFYRTRLDCGTDSNGNLAAFSGANAITGQSSSGPLTLDTSNSTTTNGTVFVSDCQMRVSI